jgi:hypothetical protein
MIPHHKLPIGIQTFAKIREDHCYYVDKTGLAVDLIEQGSHYFLSRPRRFGKSLLIDTFKELFEGNEPLFHGLAAHERWDWSAKHPVLRFSFGGGMLGSHRDLQDSLHEQLSYHEQSHGLVAAYPDHRSRFKHLIRHLYEQTGQRVVILVDEYDKPILDRLDQPEIALAIREGLKDFYSVIKDSDAYVKFAFLTGVSKFSKVSIFSGLNNLIDLTLDPAYSTLCGYTDHDLETIFAPELEGLDRDEIRRWYNGYQWLGESVYNPFDVLLLFRNRQYRAYWFETGTPTFLIKLLTERRQFTPDLERLMAPETLLSTFDVDNIPTEAILFQTGYLTIDKVRHIPGRMELTLRYPNLEVKASLNDCLLQVLSGNPSIPARHVSRLYDLLVANDLPGLRSLFRAFYASIPHAWYTNNPIAQYEGYYASVFYCYFAALGLTTIPEDLTSQGRIDLTVRFQGRIYLFEFKVVELEPEGKAIEQLKARGYADKYRASGEPIYLIGVEFSRDSRNIVGFEVEQVTNSEDTR